MKEMKPENHLARIIGDLGKHKDSVIGSLYDTSQVWRYAPPKGIELSPVITWILSQQQEDGGWGRGSPMLRVVPTLACTLLLHSIDSEKYRSHVDMARTYLSTHREEIGSFSSMEVVPVAMELTVPKMLQECEEAGIHIDIDLSQEVLGQSAKYKKILNSVKKPTMKHCFGWEAWGQNPSNDLMKRPDGTPSSIGLAGSPSATAYWIYLKNNATSYDAETYTLIKAAEDYILKAAQATASLGLIPLAFPIDLFESAFALQYTYSSGLYQSEFVKEIYEEKVHELAQSTNKQAIGFCGEYEPDCDDTAALMMAFQSVGESVDTSILTPFRRSDHFGSYPQEINPSVTVTARALKACRMAGQNVDVYEKFIMDKQSADGKWGDKWNTSWLYSSAVILMCVDVMKYPQQVKKTVDSILSMQKEDGGWRTLSKQDNSCLIETAFAILALHASVKAYFETDKITAALAHALNWMESNGSQEITPTWIAKDFYSLPRVDSVIILAAFCMTNSYFQSGGSFLMS